MAIRRSASSRLRAPMSRNCSCISGALPRSSLGMKWVGRRPTTPSTGPAAEWTTRSRPGRQLLVDAADRRERHEPLVVDVGDDEADLVGVRRDHHLGPGGGARLRPQVAERVGVHDPAVSKTLAKQALHRRLEARGRGSKTQLLEERGSNGMPHLRSGPPDSIRGPAPHCHAARPRRPRPQWASPVFLVVRTTHAGRTPLAGGIAPSGRSACVSGARPSRSDNVSRGSERA